MDVHIASLDTRSVEPIEALRGSVFLQLLTIERSATAVEQHMAFPEMQNPALVNVVSRLEAHIGNVLKLLSQFNEHVPEPIAIKDIPTSGEQTLSRTLAAPASQSPAFHAPGEGVPSRSDRIVWLTVRPNQSDR